MNPITAIATISLLATPAVAAPCHDSKGKVVKCEPKGGTHLGAAAVDGNVRRDAAGKCRVVKASPGQTPNQIMPCPK